MKKIILIPLFIYLTACTHNPKPGVEHGFTSVFTGIGHLILSPLQIAAGLLEGVSAIPYMLSTGVHDINKALIQSKAEISLADTYQYAYQEKLDNVADTGETGVVFRRMFNATEYFQKILKIYGVYNYQDYLLTSVKTANSEGYTLYAVVRRTQKTIKIRDNQGRLRTLTVGERLYYEPYETQENGEKLDEILDWTGIPRSYIKTQKGQALLMTLAANSILKNQQKKDFWDIKTRWIAGEYLNIVNKQAMIIKSKMGIN